MSIFEYYANMALQNFKKKQKAKQESSPIYQIKVDGYGKYWIYSSTGGIGMHAWSISYDSVEDAHSAIMARIEHKGKSIRVTVREYYENLN